MEIRSIAVSQSDLPITKSMDGTNPISMYSFPSTKHRFNLTGALISRIADVTGGNISLATKESYLTFDGTNDSIYTAAEASFMVPGTDSFTVSFWWTPVSIDGDSTQFVLGLWDYSETKGWYFVYDGSTDQLSAVFAGAGSTAVASGTAAGNQWHHIAAVYVPGTSLTLYVDGTAVAVDTTSIPGQILMTPSAGESLRAGYHPGSDKDDTFFDYCAGFLDAVKIYMETALSQTQIQAQYEAGRTSCVDSDEDGLTYAWTFSEGSGTESAPYVGGVNNSTTFTLDGARWWVEAISQLALSVAAGYGCDIIKFPHTRSFGPGDYYLWATPSEDWNDNVKLTLFGHIDYAGIV